MNGRYKSTPPTYANDELVPEILTDINGKIIVSGDLTIGELPVAATLADNTANPTTTGLAAFGMVYDGATWDRMPGNSADGVLVNLGTNNDVTVIARTNDVSTAAENDRVIKGSAGNLRGVSMTNANASTRFLQVHNATSAPADTAVPIASIPVPTGTTQSIDYGLDGRTMSVGIYVCASSTQNTKTLAGDDHLFDAQYT